MSGLTTTGFEKRSLEDLLAQVALEEQSEISTSLDVSDASPIGQLNAILMKTVSELWDLAQAIYTGFDPDKNTGDAQDAVGAITGCIRLAATKSYARVALGLDSSITIPVGAIVAVAGNPNTRFLLVGSEEVAGTVVAGDVASTTAGTYYARFQAEVTGPVVANAGTLSAIITPISGWNSATNALDAVVGRDVEGPSAMRQRREDELQAVGTSPVDALRADLLLLDGMSAVTVFENVDDVTDANGLPPHSIECLCYDGPTPAIADNTIAQTIWDGKAAGIQTYGNSTGDATDTLGGTRPMFFSRPTQKTVYFDITLVVTGSYAGDTAVKDAIVAYALSHLAMGDDVILAAFYGAIFGVGGVENITSFKAGFTASPSGTTDLVIALRELATFDTSRITITS